MLMSVTLNLGQQNKARVMELHEVKLAREVWKASGERTQERLEWLVRFYCEQYMQGVEYTETALEQVR